MRVLTMTTLYPNAAAPAHGVFVENRLKDFAGRTGADLRVIAPVPWFPAAHPCFGRYGAYAAAPARETRFGFDVRHPRYAIPPKVGMTYAAAALARCFLKAARAMIAEGWDFDLIDAHYLYPDGVAAVRAARALGKPVVVTARGSDVSELPRFPRQRRMILEAVARADGVVCVAQALKDELVRLGAPAEKLVVLRNGVDLDVFRPLDRDSIRTRIGVAGPVIVSVGHLIERKGHDLVIAALADLPGVTLLIAGEGAARRALEAQAALLGVADRVRFLGAVPHEALAEIYNAADALALASSREGWPNVLLEAMACGTPCVATPVWGSVEIIKTPEAGSLASDRSGKAIAEALRALLAAPQRRAHTRLYAEGFSWEETTQGLRDVFDDAFSRRRAAKRIITRPLDFARPERPRLLVSVDTEETFDWTSFERPDWTVAAPEGVDRLQMLAASFGAKPVYFLTQPVIEDERAGAYFRYLHERGAADLGLHLHQWTSPPHDGFAGEYYSWQCNLPADVQRAKLAALADAFARRFGFRARAHRAGRYGVDLAAYAAIAEAGLDLDFSPSPAFDFSAKGGPDFSRAGVSPFTVAIDGRRVVVTPAAGGRMLRGTAMALPGVRGAGLNAGRAAIPRALAAPLRLSPEGASARDLASLARRLVADGAPALVFCLHSTSLTPGASPYASDEAGVAALLDTTRRFFTFFRDELGGDFASLDDLAALYALTTSESAPLHA